MPKKRTPRRVLILGGGAAGLTAAVAAAQAGAQVTVLERADRVGKKLLKTGNGRCNLSNENISPAGYNCPDFVGPLLTLTDCPALRAFFAALGLWTVADGEGRVYPLSDTATSVLDVLRLAGSQLGVTERCAAEVVSVAPRGESGFLVRLRDGGILATDRVIVSTGGGTALLKPLGHGYIPFSPALCPLKTDVEAIRGLSGLRVKCRAALWRDGEKIAGEAGEFLFRDFGLSGILALDLSRWARPGDRLSLDLMPAMTEPDLATHLEAQHALRSDAELLTGVFHKRLGAAILRRAGSAESGAVARTIKDYHMTILGLGDTQNAQVTQGGAATENFDPLTLESRLVPGLYCVGEALDVDGRCGGYNLHWAFASGLAAGRSAAE